jgi:ketosteroid isomerase-like protein
VSGTSAPNPLARCYARGMAHPHEAIALTWLDAFNAGDVPRLVSLYAEDCTHTSPKIRTLHPETGGKLVGRAALTTWWADAMKRLPGLRYEKTALTANDERVFLEYVRHAPDGAPMPVAEVFDVRAGKIVASRVYHG